MVRNISGVILAGGACKRFDGIIKAKIVIDGKTIISRIIEILSEIFEETIIVTNVPDEFNEYKSCKIIKDLFLDKGPLGGIHSALKETDREALFVVAGDMPFLEKELIVKQVDFYDNNRCDVLIPQINKYVEPLHGIYKKNILRNLEEYLEGENDYAIREFLNKVNTRYMHLEGSGKYTHVFTNINSPSDISDIQNQRGIR